MEVAGAVKTEKAFPEFSRVYINCIFVIFLFTLFIHSLIISISQLTVLIYVNSVLVDGYTQVNKISDS